MFRSFFAVAALSMTLISQPIMAQVQVDLFDSFGSPIPGQSYVQGTANVVVPNPSEDTPTGVGLVRIKPTSALPTIGTITVNPFTTASGGYTLLIANTGVSAQPDADEEFDPGADAIGNITFPSGPLPSVGPMTRLHLTVRQTLASTGTISVAKIVRVHLTGVSGSELSPQLTASLTATASGASIQRIQIDRGGVLSGNITATTGSIERIEVAGGNITNTNFLQGIRAKSGINRIVGNQIVCNIQANAFGGSGNLGIIHATNQLTTPENANINSYPKVSANLVTGDTTYAIPDRGIVVGSANNPGSCTIPIEVSGFTASSGIIEIFGVLRADVRALDGDIPALVVHGDIGNWPLRFDNVTNVRIGANHIGSVTVYGSVGGSPIPLQDPCAVLFNTYEVLFNASTIGDFHVAGDFDGIVSRPLQNGTGAGADAMPVQLLGSFYVGGNMLGRMLVNVDPSNSIQIDGDVSGLLSIGNPVVDNQVLIGGRLTGHLAFESFENGVPGVRGQVLVNRGYADPDNVVRLHDGAAIGKMSVYTQTPITAPQGVGQPRANQLVIDAPLDGVYAQQPNELGGGWIGVLPFGLSTGGSTPQPEQGRLYPTLLQRKVGEPPNPQALHLRFFGPIAGSAQSVRILLRGMNCEYSDMTNMFGVRIGGPTLESREIWIGHRDVNYPSRRLSGVPGHFKVELTSSSDVVCVGSLLATPPKVQSFTYEFELWRDCNGNGEIDSGDGLHCDGGNGSAGCLADCDDGSGNGTPDGGVTIDDLLYYLNLFANGDPGADVDDGSSTGTPDLGVTIDDLLYYLQRFADGC